MAIILVAECDFAAVDVQQAIIGDGHAMGIATHVVQHLLGAGASGITSKPAIEDHFKTGQRTITLDELVLPYRLAVWQVQFDPVRSLIVSPEMPAVIPARRSAGPYSSPPLPASGGEL